ncbi:HlyD family secretion protein [Bacillus sp. 5mfcol3.1]|nr:HlyD family secretion protein [Bacillus sp. 5mfcol3.1]
MPGFQNKWIQSLETQQTNVEKRVEQRKVTLENERSKIESVKEGKQDMDSLHHQGETTVIKVQKDGIIQFPSILQTGDLVDSGQELISIIPKENIKKIKILMPAQEVKGIKKGDKAQYSFKLKKTDKQVGTVTYISAHPILDKNSKTYMYELEATINTKELKTLHTGMVGRASVVTREEPIWKFVFRKLDFISG